jgi:hypothetical protein
LTTFERILAKRYIEGCEEILDFEGFSLPVSTCVNVCEREERERESEQRGNSAKRASKIRFDGCSVGGWEETASTYI